MPTMMYAQALNQALREEMQRDENVFVFGEEVAKWGGSFTVTKGLLEEFGEKRIRGRIPVRGSLCEALVDDECQTGRRVRAAP